MNANVAEALAAGGIADVTTTGRRSGRPHRVEIGFHHLDGEWFITGRPGLKRDWLANLMAEPRFTLHLTGAGADVEARAEPVIDPAERGRVLYRILTEGWGNPPEKARHILPRWVEGAPLVRFELR